MCVCVCVCVCACVRVCVCVCTGARGHSACRNGGICIYGRWQSSPLACSGIYHCGCTCIFACVRAFARACVCVYTHVRTYTHTCVFMRARAHTHTHTHTRTHQPGGARRAGVERRFVLSLPVFGPREHPPADADAAADRDREGEGRVGEDDGSRDAAIQRADTRLEMRAGSSSPRGTPPAGDVGDVGSRAREAAAGDVGDPEMGASAFGQSQSMTQMQALQPPSEPGGPSGRGGAVRGARSGAEPVLAAIAV